MSKNTSETSKNVRLHQSDGGFVGITNLSGYGNLEPKVCIGAFRGRNPDNPSDRTAGSPTEQRLEINRNGTSNALTTVQKDNVVIERQIVEKRVDVGIRQFKDGCCGAVRTTDSGGDKRVIEIAGVYTGASPDFQRPPLKGLSRTLKAVNHDAGITDGIRVRKLTPRECWRLMGFKDDAFDRARTALMNKHYHGKDKANTQLYKQAGNSIVVDMLKVVFSKIRGLDTLW